ncbi:hypothetical protein L211DRAFT_13403 [Terfezia boudieri ATCC MYA-4762]|uniref:Uncharacterized protein n=1 Tax=Terfezia boudieri ATCC MYA-4762 TaxID=1051890 RepID=A0A3N4M2N5_9PEZI|nr:hypothetical protein L211DRAFT_13403 [Terfezia boudieri ATCC MYA-4762]
MNTNCPRLLGLWRWSLHIWVIWLWWGRIVCSIHLAPKTLTPRTRTILKNSKKTLKKHKKNQPSHREREPPFF